MCVVTGLIADPLNPYPLTARSRSSPNHKNLPDKKTGFEIESVERGARAWTMQLKGTSVRPPAYTVREDLQPANPMHISDSYIRPETRQPDAYIRFIYQT